MKHTIFAAIVALAFGLSIHFTSAAADSDSSGDSGADVMSDGVTPIDTSQTQLGDDPGKGRKGTGTCHDSKRKIIECYDKIKYKDGRKRCFANLGASNFHWRTNGPTCFEIINGDVSWP